MLIDEVRVHLKEKIIPFWMNLRDDEFGGYYGFVDFDLQVDKKAEKGCILNSRILWFFSNAYMLLQEEALLKEAEHAFRFLKEYCYDRENGGVFWSLNYDGTPLDDTKHTYNQAFAIYALSSYYDASKDEDALKMAWELFQVIEKHCTDELGYLEAFDRFFKPASNEKLSENGVMAEKTMNTLLHVFEGYTELYRVTKNEMVAEKLRAMLATVENRVFNPEKRRQEVFFDREWNTLIDLHSYGHDIETAWLVDRGCEVLGDEELTARMHKITAVLEDEIYHRAYTEHSLLNECECGVDDTHRIWWVQAEAMVGFLNGYQKDNSKTEYKQAVRDIWDYIKNNMVDDRDGSEWFWRLDGNHKPDADKPIVEPWKCPYHNGRMCLEVIKRGVDIE